MNYSSAHSVMANASRLGLKRRGYKQAAAYAKALDRSAAILDMWRVGHSTRTMADEIGVSHGTICQVLEDLKMARTEQRVCFRCSTVYTTHPMEEVRQCKKCRKQKRRSSHGNYEQLNRGGLVIET